MLKKEGIRWFMDGCFVRFVQANMRTWAFGLIIVWALFQPGQCGVAGQRADHRRDQREVTKPPQQAAHHIAPNFFTPSKAEEPEEEWKGKRKAEKSGGRWRRKRFLSVGGGSSECGGTLYPPLASQWELESQRRNMTFIWDENSSNLSGREIISITSKLWGK